MSSILKTIKVKKRVFLPCYQHLLKSDADIDFYWGGRDSGKSRDIAQHLIMDCLNLPYFRCLLIKKTFNTIKDSQWQTIKDVVEKWGLQEFFTFRVAPLAIECNNGNRFLARGCDEPQSIKSTNEPSHSWIEEANQLTMDDFITVTTTLRAPRGAKMKQRISFNPECDGDYKEFWLYKTFFDGKPHNGTFNWQLVTMDGKLHTYTYTVTHTTYKDNRYCTPARQIFLEQLEKIDPYYYQVYTKGIWGNRKVGDPFFYAFNKEKHVGETKPRRNLELILSFDYNVNPLTCCIVQHEGDNIWALESVKLADSDIYKMCDYIRAKYQGYSYLVTGDATGRGTSALVQDGINYYSVIKAKLELTNNQIRVHTVNPVISENRVLVNVVFHTMNIQIDPVNCKDLIFDLINVEVDEFGKLDKGDRNNPKRRSDFGDCWRYYCNTFHRSRLKS